MDAVKSFNGELSALYEIKPPISKAKMTAITKGAIKVSFLRDSELALSSKHRKIDHRMSIQPNKTLKKFTGYWIHDAVFL